MPNKLGHPTRDLSPEEHWLNEHLPVQGEDVTLTLPGNVVDYLRDLLLGAPINKEDYEAALEEARSEGYSEGYDDGEYNGEQNGFDSRDDEVSALEDELKRAQEMLDEQRGELEDALGEITCLNEKCEDLEDELSNLKESL